jgi:hypothetical protein
MSGHDENPMPHPHDLQHSSSVPNPVQLQIQHDDPTGRLPPSGEPSDGVGDNPQFHIGCLLQHPSHSSPIQRMILNHPNENPPSKIGPSGHRDTTTR